MCVRVYVCVCVCVCVCMYIYVCMYAFLGSVYLCWFCQTVKLTRTNLIVSDEFANRNTLIKLHNNKQNYSIIPTVLLWSSKTANSKY